MCWVVLTWLATGTLAAAPADIPLLQELTEQGVVVQPGLVVRLPASPLPSGLDAAAQGAAIEKVAAQYPRELFLRRSVVAPFVLRMESVNGSAGERVAQRVSVWFVAYGSLQAVRDERLLREMAGSLKHRDEKSAASAEPLRDDELRQRMLAATRKSGEEEWYVRFTFPVLERLQVSGVLHLLEQASPDSVVLCALLDPRFAADREYRNHWRPLVRDERGDLSVGDPRPYAGFGGYAKATALRQPAGALFIECHAVFREPADWFGGANLLRSKLPLVIQDNVRTLRRKLAAHRPPSP
jgi:hypothetical protein